MEQVIKFRALKDDMSNCIFMYGQLVYDAIGRPRITEIDSSGKGLTFHTCLKGTEGQFTGLLDKHGKEIYCGDIVQDEEMGKAIVVFQSGCYFMKYDAESTMGFLGMKEDRFGRLQLERVVEIIGNIHQIEPNF